MTPDYGPLFEPVIPSKSEVEAKSARKRFDRFLRENPHVFGEVVRLCRQMKAAGARRWSVKAAFEVLRYQMQLQTVRLPGEFKLDNSHTAPMARRIIAECPDLADFFETRGRGDA
jgi:hypothetical protein